MAYSQSEQASHILGPKPTERGSDGDTKVTTSPGASTSTYWRWEGGPGGDWKRISKNTYETANPEVASYTALAAPNLSSTTGSIRYPKDAAMSKESDYVLFEFYKYQPPFQGINRGDVTSKSSGISAYNASVTDEQFYEKTTLDSVILYMPEDISTGYKANWSGKAFSNLGRDILSLAGSGDIGQALSNAGEFVDTSLNQLLPNAGEKTIEAVIGKITGEQVSPNDIFGSTRGVILNPNVELLFSGIDLRNFALNYRLVPRNDREASDIRKIINVFRKAMLPSFAQQGDITFSSAEAAQDNFIRVPNVCRVSFMKGSGLNKYVPQYKMCAITQVDINYTPDGTYATYGDGSMVAIELSLAFQETKLIFAEEVENY